jgi:hypothetical protein
LTTRDDGAFVSPWKVILDVVENGRLRSAGVSNFQPDHLERIISETGVAPVVNQIEAHPYFRNEDARKASHEHAIAVQAWGPLGQGDRGHASPQADLDARPARAHRPQAQTPSAHRLALGRRLPHRDGTHRRHPSANLTVHVRPSAETHQHRRHRDNSGPAGCQQQAQLAHQRPSRAHPARHHAGPAIPKRGSC